MSGINIVTKSGPKTFKAAETITGGQIIEAKSTGVGPAAADSEKVLGVALIDAAPHSEATGNDITLPKPEHTSVAYSGAEVYLTTTAQLAFGDKVGVDAAGKAKKWTAGDVVGVVTDPAPTATRALVRLS